MRRCNGLTRAACLGVAATALTALMALAAGPALACGGLIGPNGGVSLVHTTTLVGYHNGIEHYVTGFDFTGGTGNFGSIIPLPAIPTSIQRGGAWTLQRLVRETQPPVESALGEARQADAPSAQVIQRTTIGALDITVLKGGGFAVGSWAKDNGFSLPPDAPALLDFYARRSPIFLAARFDAAAARAQGQGAGSVTPIHITMPTPNPWVPLAILTLGKQPGQFVQADVYLLTDRQPAMLPAPTLLGSPQTSTNGLTLARSEPASASLLSDLHGDQGMGWVDTNGMWFTYLQLDTAAVNLHYDLAVDQSGRGAPSLIATGLPAAKAGLPGPPPAGPSRWVWILTAAGAVALMGSWAGTYRRSLPA
jgi:hypothetical protein